MAGTARYAFGLLLIADEHMKTERLHLGSPGLENQACRSETRDSPTLVHSFPALPVTPGRRITTCAFAPRCWPRARWQPCYRFTLRIRRMPARFTRSKSTSATPTRSEEHTSE